MVPTGTPKEIVNRPNREVVAVPMKPEVKAIFYNQGAETVGSSPDALRAFITVELAKFARVIKLEE